MTLKNISAAARQKLLQTALERAKARVEARRDQPTYQFRGNQARIQTITDDEVILGGPARTGKSLAWLYKLNWAAWKWPGMRGLIVRKTRVSLTESGLVTFERAILGEDNPICAGAQRANRSLYTYPNGSEIVVGGIDRPSRIMSTEFDLIYVQEASELTLEDWESLVSRLSNGAIPWQQIAGDTNPDRADHWIIKRAESGALKLLDTQHRDNPIFYDDDGVITERGRQYLRKLHRLTGVRRLRLLDGKWVSAEGAVYEDYSAAVHVVDRFAVPKDWRRICAIDFGYTNPFVCQWWAVDPDGRMYRYRELYQTQRTVAEHAKTIFRAMAGMTPAQVEQLKQSCRSDDEFWRKLRGMAFAKERIERWVADHDAEDRATLEHLGIKTEAAKKAISVGIQAVQARLVDAGDGRPRIFFMRDSLVEVDDELEEAGKPTCTEDELPGYTWPKGVDGKSVKEVPVDMDNHGCDGMRYAVMAVDGPRPAPMSKGKLVGLYSSDKRRKVNQPRT